MSKKSAAAVAVDPVRPTGLARKRVAPSKFLSGGAPLPPLSTEQMAEIEVKREQFERGSQLTAPMELPPLPSPPPPPRRPIDSLSRKRSQQLTTSAPSLLRGNTTVTNALSHNSVAAAAKRVTAHDILDADLASLSGRASVPATPSTNSTSTSTLQPVPTAAERASQRGSIDEKKFYSDCYSQTMKWVALAKIGQNYIATAVTAETAVDFSRAEEPDATRAPVSTQ